jgi:hypothetical protein
LIVFLKVKNDYYRKYCEEAGKFTDSLTNTTNNADIYLKNEDLKRNKGYTSNLPTNANNLNLSKEEVLKLDDWAFTEHCHNLGQINDSVTKLKKRIKETVPMKGGNPIRSASSSSNLASSTSTTTTTTATTATTTTTNTTNTDPNIPKEKKDKV